MNTRWCGHASTGNLSVGKTPTRSKHPSLATRAVRAAAMVIDPLMLVPLSALAASMPGTADAQATAADSLPESRLEEVMVTAQRREERLQDVPISVSSFAAAEIQSMNVRSIADLAVVAPTLVYSQEFGLIRPRLRGIGTQSDGPGVESPVAIYVDGVYYASQTAGAFQFNSIEAVEVINGPQGTLFGRNATGGLIQVRTREPSHNFGGSASIGYGNYQTTVAEAYVTGGITETLSADVSVKFQNQGQGFGRNLYTGTDIDWSDFVVARSKWLYTPTDNLTIHLAFDYNDTRARPGAQLYPGSIPIGGPSPVAQRPHDAYGAYDSYLSTSQRGVAATIDYDLSFARLTSISSYRHAPFFDRLSGMQIANPALARETVITEPHTQVTQEVQLSSLPGAFMTWTTGLYYFHELSKYTPAMLHGPYFERGGLSSANFYTRNSTDSGAAYAQAAKEILNETNLTLGLRYTKEWKEFRYADQYLGIDGSIVSSHPDSSGSDSWGALTWRVALDHKFNENTLAYVSYNRGFKSGGYNTVQFPFVTYEPEQLDAYEIGQKSEILDGRARLNAAVYYYSYRNLQLHTHVGDLVAIVNGGKSELYGLDLDAEARVTSNLTVRAGVALEHAEFTDYPDAPTTVPRPTGGNGSAFFDAKGNRLPYVPKAVVNLSAMYTVPTSAGNLDFSGGYSYNSGYFGEEDNRLHQGPFGIVNGQIGFVSHNGFGVKVWGRNLTNKDYAQRMLTNALADFIIYGEPRMYGVTLTQDFGG
jgi:iron complex outermembrane recepter protein